MVERRNRGQPLVKVTIFFEGGGEKEVTQSKHREGLSNYCSHVSQKPRRLRIVAGGGREQTFDKFRRAVLNSRNDELIALLVDAENPVTANSPAEHLRACDRWEFPAADNFRVFLMVQMMESWFLADRDALTGFYDGGFQANSLPGSPFNVENIRKEDVDRGLKNATRNTRSKVTYDKIGHGPALLALIDPKKVEAASPHAKKFNDFLKSL